MLQRSICLLMSVPPADACICQHTAHSTSIAINRCGDNTRTAGWRMKVNQHRCQCSQICHRWLAVVAPLGPLPLGWSGYPFAVLLISRTDQRMVYSRPCSYCLVFVYSTHRDSVLHWLVPSIAVDRTRKCGKMSKKNKVQNTVFSKYGQAFPTKRGF